jgi:predicted GIY-YIG superfamily endonuclease
VTSVYILRCADNTFYVGHTDSVAERLLAHNAGTASHYTAARRPLVLVYSEALPTTSAAIRREKQLKRWSGQKKRALVTGELVGLKSLSGCHQQPRPLPD